VPAAIVVLGCRVVLGASHEPLRLQPSALQRRVEMGARTYRTYLARGDARTVVVVSGGRRWGDVVEADAMAQELVARGVPERAIVRERCSLSTRENAHFTAEVLARRGTRGATLVTCSWHMARALAVFSLAGLEVEAVAARDGEQPPWSSQVWRLLRERALTPGSGPRGFPGVVQAFRTAWR
jgi:uncharacterized SAM-binding protein YcdF (DUF218 family)